MINKIYLIGHVGKDPVYKQLADTTVCSFTIATTDKFGGTETTEWHNITTWNKLADIANQYVRKGMKLYVEGKVTYRTYDDKDGNKRYVTEIRANDFKMLDKKEEVKTEPLLAQKPPVKQAPQRTETPVDDILPF